MFIVDMFYGPDTTKVKKFLYILEARNPSLVKTFLEKKNYQAIAEMTTFLHIGYI